MYPLHPIITPVAVPSRYQVHPIISIFTASTSRQICSCFRPSSQQPARLAHLEQHIWSQGSTIPTCNSSHCSSSLRTLHHPALSDLFQPEACPLPLPLPQGTPATLPSLSGSQAFALQAPAHHQALGRLLPLAPLWGTPPFPSAVLSVFQDSFPRHPSLEILVTLRTLAMGLAS